MRADATADSQSVTINIRAPRQQRDLIDRAADCLGKTRTEFMLDAARKAAEDTLLDQRIFAVDQDRFQRLCDILDAPAAPDPKLSRLMGRKAPWER